LLLFDEVFNALYFIFPAYCANASPVIFGGGKPIDCGRSFFDGKPIFGSHKTYRGFTSGLLIGTFVGWVQEAFAPTVGLPKGSILAGLALSFGALLGDLIGSFVKRRLNLKPGAPLPVIDQIDFVLFALLFALAVKPELFPPLRIVLTVALTGPIHVLVNLIAYLLHLKDKPW